MVLMFQNCGGHKLMDESQLASNSIFSSSDKLAVSAKLLDEETEDPEETLPGESEEVVRFEVPKALEFGEVWQVGVLVNGAVGTNVNFQDDDRFPYKMRLPQGTVYDVETGKVIYKLTSSEKAALKALFVDTFITKKILANTAVCAQVYSYGYARLTTNIGYYELGSKPDSCSTLDLVSIATKTSVGLDLYLEQLAAKIETLKDQQEETQTPSNCSPGMNSDSCPNQTNTPDSNQNNRGTANQGTDQNYYQETWLGGGGGGPW